jgi:hypothetical protein
VLEVRGDVPLFPTDIETLPGWVGGDIRLTVQRVSMYPDMSDIALRLYLEELVAVVDTAAGTAGAG